MISIRRILCPTNLLSESDEALRYAVALAFAYKAKLFLLYCRGNGSNYDGVDSNTHPIGRGALFAESLAPNLGMNDIRDLNWEGLLVENVVDIGNVIVTEAANRGVDLIVMRSRRRPHVAFLLGSTAETVCRTAHCTVFVTHPVEREWVGLSTGEIDLNRILVAYDFSSEADVALDYATSLAQEYQTELHLLNVIPEGGQGEPELAWAQKTETPYVSAARKLQCAIPKEAFLWCGIVTEVRFGKAYEEVLEYAKEREIDLICVGASNDSLGALLGSNVDRILRQAPCPVLISRTTNLSDFAASTHAVDQPERNFNKEGKL